MGYPRSERHDAMRGIFAELEIGNTVIFDARCSDISRIAKEKGIKVRSWSHEKYPDLRWVQRLS